MLTEKDYCDKDTAFALQELGYNPYMFYDDGTPVIHLWDAQKWLRESKKIIVLVGFDFCPITSEIVYNWVIVVNGNTAKKSSYTYDYFEEALLEGVKCAVKILKENE